ncbi:unnamed protein product [Auanema sp. JU1783]|nr:unnamed protein product [Auanema sp. JU1783]
MDYYQQGRAQASNQSNAHFIYSNAPATGTSQTAQMYYQPQAMTHQPLQSSYQQHYQTPGSANASIDYSSQHNHQPSAMTVPATNNRGGSTRGTGNRSGNGPVDATQITGRYINTVPSNDLPLRIVIDSKHVGAIIGTAGTNIRELSKESKARVVVDAFKTVKDQQGNAEKVISIIGPGENSSKACVKIMEIVQHELEKDESNEIRDVELKIRAYNQLVGRLIGKQGATIKKIMQETGTTIYVSNEHTPRPNQNFGNRPPFPDLMQMERTITVKGPTIESVSSAEHKITSKLRQSHEADLQNRMPFNNVPGAVPGLLLGPDPFNARFSKPLFQSTHVAKVVKMWVPNPMVGAIIGAKGTNIRSIMRGSGANIRIEGGEKREKEKEDEVKEEVENSSPSQEDKDKDNDKKQGAEKKPEEERLVTITGSDDQQYRAQFYIFQRVAEQTNHFIDDVALRMELSVPSRLVGRLIGKGGQNVRELQRITGANVKIPEDEVKEKEKEENTQTSEEEGKEEVGTVVRIVGNFNATQSVQYRILKLINEFNHTSINDKNNAKKTSNSEESNTEQKQNTTTNSGNGSTSD